MSQRIEYETPCSTVPCGGAGSSGALPRRFCTGHRGGNQTRVVCWRRRSSSACADWIPSTTQLTIHGRATLKPGRTTFKAPIKYYYTKSCLACQYIIIMFSLCVHTCVCINHTHGEYFPLPLFIYVSVTRLQHEINHVELSNKPLSEPPKLSIEPRRAAKRVVRPAKRTVYLDIDTRRLFRMEPWSITSPTRSDASTASPNLICQRPASALGQHRPDNLLRPPTASQ